MAETWLVCSACRSDIAFGSKYFQCSVSTCNRARMRLVFCSVSCWDSHVATLRHRDAWAEDKIAPTKAAWERELAESDAPRPAAPRPAPPAPAPRPSPAPSSSSPAPSPAASIERGRSPSPPAEPAGPLPPDSLRSSIATPVAPRPVPISSGAPAASSTSSATAAAPPRRIVGESAPAAGVHLNDIVDNDILIVVSKLKKYIKERSGMNCSDAVAEVLSDHVRALCDDSIRAAGRDERKTVLDRDVPRPRR